MDETTGITIILVQAVICAILCAVVAGAKNRDTSGWAVVGLITGILGLIAIAGMPSLPEKKTVKIEGNNIVSQPVFTDLDERVECTCPKCHAELIINGTEKEKGIFDCPECGQYIRLERKK
ncbi:MAG: hypothetical protein ACE5K8_00950, partial [Candidatus Zixiibacteriota bacterium]